jgi:hypothetical protein
VPPAISSAIKANVEAIAPTSKPRLMDDAS